MTLEKIALIQKVYSQLYLDGHIDDATYKAVVNATFLGMNGFNDISLMQLSNDMLLLDKLGKRFDNIQKSN